MLQAICVTHYETVVSVYVPADATDAEYRRIIPGLKLSCPTTIDHATMVDDPSEWDELRRKTSTRAKIASEAFDL
jgi:hypothetical protein